MLDELGRIAAEEKRDFVEIILRLELGQKFSHEGVDDRHYIPNSLELHASPFDVLLRGWVLLLLWLGLIIRVLALFGVVLVDGAGEHHEEGEEDIEVVGLC